MDVRSQATIRRCCCFQGSEGDKPTKLITSVRGRWCDFLRRLKNTSPHARPFQGDQPTVSSRLSRLSLLSLSLSVFICTAYEKCGGKGGGYRKRETRIREKEFEKITLKITRRSRFRGCYWPEGWRVFHSILLVFGRDDYGKRQSRQGWSEQPAKPSARSA